MKLIQFLAMKLHRGPVFIDDMLNLTDVVVHSKTNFMKVVQNQVLFRKTLMHQKICSRWIPHNLSIAQKKARVVWSKEMLQIDDRGASKHFYYFVTGDESWMYAYEPESKQQSTGVSR